jgi:hypothetical protein
MALVGRGETTVDELRRVAAEPTRAVSEGMPDSSRAPVRVGWWPPADVAGGTAIVAEQASGADGAGALVDVDPATRGISRLDELDALILALLRWRSGR